MSARTLAKREFGIDFDHHFAQELKRLGEMERDGLVRLEKDALQIAALGRIFTRNIAMVFDDYMAKAESLNKRVFEDSIKRFAALLFVKGALAG